MNAPDVPASDGELLACFLSHEFENGERVNLGANVNFARAAVLLAHHLRAPDLTIMVGNSWTNFAGTDRIHLHADTSDFRDARWAESWLHLDIAMIEYPYFSNAFVIGGLQIDPFGNSNLLGLRDDEGGFRFRGPGPIGTTSHTAYADRFYLATARHTPQVFVESCDFVSSVGWRTPSGVDRSELGLSGGGPKYCLTPLCVFDFEEETHRMRLKSLNRGTTIEEVVENTGFEPIIPASVPTTPSPDPHELEVLRNVIDREGLLRDRI